jgi:two-component system, OmpR family, sensor kinase
MTPVHSIRFRSALILSLLVTVMWLATALVTARILTDEMDEVFDSALQETGQRVLELAVIDVLGREEAGLAQHITALDTHDEYFTYIVRDDLGRILLSSHRADPAQFLTFDKTGFHQNDDFRFYQETAVSGTITLIIAEPIAHRQSVSHELAIGLGLPLLFVIPLSILGIIYSLGFGLRPLGQLRSQLARRGENDLTPLATDTLPSELKPIAGTMNQLFGRLSAAFDAERSFASNAAHELRTPLAGAIAQTQRLAQQTKEPETAKRALEIEVTLKRLTQMSERLMQLARAEGAQLTASDPHDLGIVLRLVVDDLNQSDRARTALILPDAKVMTEIDPDAIAIVARNLIENALRYGSDAQVTVNVSRDGWLTVENDCAAVPAYMLSALSDRFMRGDHDSEGSGLGLAIVQKIAERTASPLQFTSPLPSQTRGFRASIQLGRHR